MNNKTNENLEDDKINNVNIKFVYEFNKEEHEPKLMPILEGKEVVTGSGISGDKIVLKDSKGIVLGESIVDEDGKFQIETIMSGGLIYA